MTNNVPSCLSKVDCYKLLKSGNAITNQRIFYILDNKASD